MPAGMLTDFPHFAIFMPCKLAICEDNGETIISTMNMEIMLKLSVSNSMKSGGCLKSYLIKKHIKKI